MEERISLKTAAICGAGHSGSTLLGMLLGSHSSAFYMGEGGKVRYLGDKSKPLQKRVCKICGESCRVWGNFRWDRTAALYPQVAQRVGRRLIVDSTKNDQWIAERAAETRAVGGEPYLILLHRDGRGVLNSRLRKYPDRQPEALVREWMAQMERSQTLYDAFHGPKITLRYETLAANPETTLRTLSDWLGIAYESDMLRFQDADHHPLGGNNGTQYLVAKARFENSNDAFVKLSSRVRGYYENHDNGIRLDTRWRHELSAEHMALFNDLAGHLNTMSMQGD